MPPPIKLRFFPWFAIVVVYWFASCGYEPPAHQELSEDQQHEVENALAGLDVATELEVRMVAGEPSLRDPTNIDVDYRGRIWVTEGFNYRPHPGIPMSPEGDRILILEDHDGDGVADTVKVFYQGPEINVPLGICVLPDRVIVSQSPYVWAFFDDDGDDRADRKEILFQGIQGEQHDHGVHAFSFGPDGKLYFNFGNEGKTLKDKNNKEVLDQFGEPIGSPKYKQGMVFRCDPDGSNLERLGHNFRNNYEAAIDSYGTIWQSDNDDDGNRGVRINYVMEYGNFGFTDEITGAQWRSERVNREDSVPFRHWYQNDPGVVPNLLHTGSGSPTGMVVYEGDLLPERFRNQMIHCEPGHNVVRAYPVENDGAGYKASIADILTGARDQWFRPSDVCVAPDGSLIVADWYDPVVGGHAANDRESGRIYRIAPKGVSYTIPRFDFTTPEGAVKALQNPNLSARSMAWAALQRMGATAVPALEEHWRSGANDRMRARAFWALTKLPGGEKYIAEAVRDKNASLRIVALRAARQLNADPMQVVGQLVNDPDPQVRRECALALHLNKKPEAATHWAALAVEHDGKDRWYLEALGIGAAGQWDRFFNAYLQKVPDPLSTAAGRDIVWRSRATAGLPYLTRLASNAHEPLTSRLRYLRAFHFYPELDQKRALLKMLQDNKQGDMALNAVILESLDRKTVEGAAFAGSVLDDVLRFSFGKKTYFQLVSRYERRSELPALIQFITTQPESEFAPQAAGLVLNFKGEKRFEEVLSGEDEEAAANLLTVLGRVGNEQTLNSLRTIMLDEKYDGELRVTAARMLGRSYAGEDMVFNLIKAGSIPEPLLLPVVEGLQYGPRKEMHDRVKKYLSSGPSAAGEKEFNRQAVLDATGDPGRGSIVFKNNCMICHQVGGEGVDFGPKLTAIGSKLPKDGLLESIINPSAGIGFGYETTEIEMKNGSVLQGIVISRSDNELELRVPGGTTQKMGNSEIKTTKQVKKSMMPDLRDAVSQQELADLLAYLGTLKN